MMLFLIGDIPDHIFPNSRTDSEGRITFLPGKTVESEFIVNPAWETVEILILRFEISPQRCRRGMLIDCPHPHPKLR